MATVFLDGFDKYGSNSVTVYAGTSLLNLILLEWTSVDNAIILPSIGASLNGISGYSLYLPTYNYSEAFAPTSPYMSKTLPSSYSRIIGGIRINSALNTTYPWNINLLSTGGVMCSVCVNSSGKIYLASGAASGSTIAVSSGSIASNSTHYIEWDITFASSGGAYTVWLDGAQIFTGTANTSASVSPATCSSISLMNATGSNDSTMGNCYIDDLYLFSTAGSLNNAVLNTGPFIQTQFPNADSGTVQFSIGQTILGQAYGTTSNTNAPGANYLFLRPFTPTYNCTINSVSVYPGATSGTANIQAVIYGDNSGSPHTLLSAGTTVTGITSGTILTSNLTTPWSLNASTQYWLGFITDTSIALYETDTSTTGQKASNTFGSGAPSTAPSMTTGQADWMIWGNIVPTTHYTQATQNPSALGQSYNYSSTIGNADMYDFQTVSTSNAIYATGVKALVSTSVVGPRTVNVQLTSGSHTSTGSASGFSTSQSWSLAETYYDTDPNTSSAWTSGGLNAASAGVEVNS